MMVSAGFTAPLEGKKLPSTTYRLSTSWARQFGSSAELRGSRPNLIVPFKKRVYSVVVEGFRALV